MKQKRVRNDGSHGFTIDDNLKDHSTIVLRI